MPQAKKTTIDHLLTHTSGLVSWDRLEENESTKCQYRSPAEILGTVKNKKLLFKPGEHFSYSNTGYLILGIVIEQITEKPYKEAVENYIINRINSYETGVITAQTVNEMIVQGHHRGGVLTETVNYANPFAAGAIVATPRDLILFFQALLNSRLLSQDSLQKMFTDMNLMAAPRGSRSYYGKGIVAAIDTPVGDIIGHTGGIRGFGAVCIITPKKHFCMCHDE